MASQLTRLCTAGVLAYCSYSICRAPLLPLYARELGAGPSLVGFVVGASTLTGIALKLPAGALSDLFGRRRLLLAGAIVTESIFNIQGVGGYIYRGIQTRDGVAVVGAVTALVIVYLFVNLLVDLLYGFLDPRISHD